MRSLRCHDQRPHYDPLSNKTTCQLHMRSFADSDTIYVGPFRAKAFPVKCGLKLERSSVHCG